MSDIKKKFLDILFEPEAEEIEAEAPLTEVKHVTPEKKQIREENLDNRKSPNVKDVLYGKQDKPSSFIDYFEVPKRQKQVEPDNDTYEMRENVSPIFGPIVQKERKKKTATEKDIQKAVSTNMAAEFTGIVISPIYGYDANKANDARKTLAGQIKEETEVFFEEEVPFEIPEDMKETIKEAVQEAVIELNPSSYSIDDFNNNVINEQQETTEDIYSDEEELSEEIIDEQEDIKDELVDEEYKPQEELVEDFSDLEEVVEDYKFEEVVEDIKEDEEELPLEEPFEDVEETNIDTNKEELEEEKDYRDDIEDFPQKANRSIYDTTPIQLFDFDDIEDKKDSESDLFDELIGDDD